jgi:FSR family fosmidomycin resistance protein-like MFS transporter
VEFVDELVFGAQGAALPLVRSELRLDYVAIGLLLSLPTLVADVVEMPIGLLADGPQRRRLIIGGGVVFTVALAGAALSQRFVPLLCAFALLYPASGAFVTLSQADLMDAQPDRQEQNMARWTLAGSLGALAGPGLVAVVLVGGAGWRVAYAALAVAAAITVLALAAQRRAAAASAGDGRGIGQALVAAVRSLRRWDVLRALALLEVADLMLDVLTGYVALYFVDTLHEPAWVGALAVGIRIGSGLAGDFVSVQVLERTSGTAYVRLTALATVAAYPALLLLPGTVPKLLALALVSVLTAGWYPVLQARLYRSLPGQSGAQLAIANVVSLAAAPIPAMIGVAAERFGLGAALWILAVAPMVLVLMLRPPGRAR